MRKYETGSNEELCITDLNQPGFKEVFDAMRSEAKKRVNQLFYKGSFMVNHERRKLVRKLGIILSLEKRIMVQITSPPKKTATIEQLNFQICAFSIDQLLTDSKTGKYKHLNAKCL